MNQTFLVLLFLRLDLSFHWLLALPVVLELPWDLEPREHQKPPHHPRERQERQGLCHLVVQEDREVPGGRVFPPCQAVLVFPGCRAYQWVPANISSNTARLANGYNSPWGLYRRTSQHLPASQELQGLPSHPEVL